MSKIVLIEDPFSLTTYSRTPIPSSTDTINHSTIKSCFLPLQTRLANMRRFAFNFHEVSGTSSSYACVVSGPTSWNRITEMTLPINELYSMNFSYITAIHIRLHIVFGAKFILEGSDSNSITLAILESTTGSYAYNSSNIIGTAKVGANSSAQYTYSNELIINRTYSSPSTLDTIGFTGFHQVSGYTTGAYANVGVKDFQMSAFITCDFNRS